MKPMVKLALVPLVGGLLLTACVTYTVNSDGSLQSTKVDKYKLSNTYVDLAIEYQQHNTPQVALDRANLAINTDSGNARAYMVRAMIYQQLGKMDAANSDFQTALNKKPDYADAYVNYAVFLCDQKKYPEAEQNFSQALNNPLYVSPEVGYYDRGQCRYQQQGYESANADYLKAMSYRNVPQDIYVSMAQLQFDLKNYTLANYYINKFEGSQTPGSMWLHIQILQALLDSGVEPAKIREYTGYRNTLGQVLVNNYGDSPEAQKYLVNYSGGKKSVPKSAPVVTSTNFISSAASTTTSTTPTTTTTIVPLTSAVTPAIAGASSSKTSGTSRRYVIVKPGETLYRIGVNNSISPQKIEQINGLKGQTIKPGMKLYLE